MKTANKPKIKVLPAGSRPRMGTMGNQPNIKMLQAPKQVKMLPGRNQANIKMLPGQKQPQLLNAPKQIKMLSAKEQPKMLVSGEQANLLPAPKQSKLLQAGEQANGIKANVQKVVERETGKVASWSMPEGGLNINGRYYSQHALERMAPDTIQVRAELGKRAHDFALKKGYEFGSKDYIVEIKNYIQPRNIPPSVVEDAIKSGIKHPGNTLGTFEFITNDVKVIINSEGNVISVIPK